MRLIGDDYIKAGESLLPRYLLLSPNRQYPEFRRHKQVTNPVYIMGFLSQWKMYLDHMPENRSAKFSGKKLDPTVFEKVGGTG
jgi:hypothetical protein